MEALRPTKIMRALHRLWLLQVRLVHLRLLQFKEDQRGQDMIEYALLAAAIAVVVAGFLPPAVIPAVSTIFSKITSTMALS
jgi:Flp pilus assembly pilin Flp